MYCFLKDLRALYLVFSIEIPPNIPSEFVELLKKLKELCENNDKMSETGMILLHW